jgi:hypothetical protein
MNKLNICYLLIPIRRLLSGFYFNCTLINANGQLIKNPIKIFFNDCSKFWNILFTNKIK